MSEIEISTEETLDRVIEQVERAYLEKLMNELNGSKYAVAKAAGISYNRLLRRLDFHQILPQFVARGR